MHTKYFLPLEYVVIYPPVQFRTTETEEENKDHYHLLSFSFWMKEDNSLKLKAVFSSYGLVIG